MSLNGVEIAEVQNIVESALKDHSHKFFPVFQRDDRELLERIVRVEEELKYLREDMKESRKEMNQRFAESREEMNQRFAESREEMNRRFTESREEMNQRFGQIDKRFTIMQWSTNLGFAILAALISVYKFIQ